MATLIKADPGYFALLIDAETYDEDKTVRMVIIAWQFEANGLIRPRTLNPSHDTLTPIFVIEEPGGQVYAYDQNAVLQLRAKSLKDWLQIAQLSRAQPHDGVAPSNSLQ